MVIERGVVYLVGAGPGDPGLLTLRAREILQEADCVIYDYLLHPQILDHVPAQAERIFVGKKGGAQAAGQDAINDIIVRSADPQRVVVRLKGGDPFCFGRGGEEARALRRAGITFRVVPGVTSGIAAPAYAGIPVTDRDLASSVCFLTGTEKPGSDRHDWAALARMPTLVIYMGVGQFPSICASLLANGKDPATPVAAIRWGTWPHQQVLAGVLGTFVERLHAASFSAPAIIVIGAVAALHRELDWCQLGPLAGRTMVVAGVQRQDPLTLGLEQVGARVIHCPGEALILPLQGVTFGEQWASCACLVFTSRAGVKNFMEIFLAQFGDLRKLHGKTVAAIGPSCAEELRRYHIIPDIMPTTHDTQHLVDAIKTTLQPCSVWHPCAIDNNWSGPPRLAAAGFDYYPLPVYRAQARSRVMQLTEEHVDAVCMASPSAVRRYHESMQAADHQRLQAAGCVFFAIGAATAKVMSSLHIPVHQIAAKSTTNSLLDTISAYFAPSSSI